jgi:hypothetical protein
MAQHSTAPQPPRLVHVRQDPTSVDEVRPCAREDVDVAGLIGKCWVIGLGRADTRDATGHGPLSRLRRPLGSSTRAMTADMSVWLKDSRHGRLGQQPESGADPVLSVRRRGLPDGRVGAARSRDGPPTLFPPTSQSVSQPTRWLLERFLA